MLVVFLHSLEGRSGSWWDSLDKAPVWRWKEKQGWRIKGRLFFSKSELKKTNFPCSSSEISLQLKILPFIPWEKREFLSPPSSFHYLEGMHFFLLTCRETKSKMLMDWQCLQWGEQFSAGRLVGRIPSCSHWIIALNHSHVGRIPFWGSSQYCQTPAVAIEWYYARSEILFIEIPIWFFSPSFSVTSLKWLQQNLFPRAF